MLVYKEKLDQGIKQSALLKEIKKQGISLAEVRREYIKDQKELEDIAKTAKENEIKWKII